MRIPDLSSAASRIPCDILRDQASHIPDDPYLIDDHGRSLTFGQADDLADRHARGYFELGIGNGDRVAFFMDNSATTAATSFGVNRLGAIWSPVSTDYRGHWLSDLLNRIDAQVLV
ncbi:MAG: crotonobetaine/carnitine-CoA ligase, partial [Aeromicrobium sp.]|nr:crotonobetaine/carnitine-CoA ligase [Aeromicrobium sp.]